MLVRVSRGVPELLILEDALCQMVSVVTSWHQCIAEGEKTPIHSLCVEEGHLVESCEHYLDIIRAHIFGWNA